MHYPCQRFVSSTENMEVVLSPTHSMGRRYHCYGRVDWYPAGAATAIQPAYPTWYMILASYCVIYILGKTELLSQNANWLTAVHSLSLLVSPFYKNIPIPPSTHRISQQQKTIWHLKRSFMYFLWYQILKKRSFKVIKLHVMYV